MLRSTFQHIKGISKKSEKKLWEQGITTWDDFDPQTVIRKKRGYDDTLENSLVALKAGDTSFFVNRLDHREYYRIALTYSRETLFLAVEKTGRSLYYDRIILVGWSIANQYGVYIQGEDDSDLRQALNQAKVVVTFNGTLLDLKFLKKSFKEIPLPLARIDLAYFAKRVGYNGGQKSVERDLGFQRNRESNESNESKKVEPASHLWHRYRKGENQALKQLIVHNHNNIEGMKHIFDHTINNLFSLHSIPEEARIYPTFSNSPTTINWVKNRSEKNSSYNIYIDDYQGSAEPIIKFDDLNQESRLDHFTVIGIDLVSSEKKKTGYCILQGREAVTYGIKTDEQMIQLALDHKADLISIDSPLSIPKGRTDFFDDDPTRNEHGITRECERILKQRGINVYPCLIASMQKLTRRGMLLAQKFRELGIPVIESYPGGTQDILSIPRKQAGLPYLIDGLVEFGIKGDFIMNKVSHDELDAITAAIVGQFYHMKMFESLGSEEEGVLIVPSF